ncbi:hypothetical protein BOTCAL_0303g00030 [Botryotinia calthae]|uniref:Major facilitator superfamily (MFS) profile domain-containing protein n=1 Tax=Botryotinia calthae TaxID=38488 RepID=A0A4Y8CUA1_9HELO|nr:hypothetical protein BOTCAL_0303g00030 [Botryotinia calthae]
MADDRGVHDDSKNHMMSPKGGSEKTASANLEIASTLSQASAIILDHNGLPLVSQPSCSKDDPLTLKAMGMSSKAAAYSTTTCIIIGGLSPFIGNPCTNVYGSRPIALLSMLTTVIGGIVSACSPNFATLVGTRAICGF